MLKSRYFCGGSILAVALAFGGVATAQDATVEEVVVTGSFIAGTPEDAALPVDVISQKELEARGSPTMVQFIKTIPSSGAVIGENNRFGGGSGAATINLAPAAEKSAPGLRAFSKLSSIWKRSARASSGLA